MSIARFWRETPRRYNLGGSKCSTCGTVYFPPRAVCPECTSHRQSLEKMVPFQLSGDGEVLSYTVVHEPAEGFEMQVPYPLALVKTVEGPVLTGQVVDIDPKDLRIGLKVHATFRKLREEGKAGVIHYGYKFAPTEEPVAAPVPSAPTTPATSDPAAARDRTAV
ncbi:MAG TPA: Zn-ribbon domain-containing OB-fold protein [Thermoplasmata archaeon]|nr:Zn-ribbon domain-containing OB-fold protein [Thermoplasmata archaeon]